MGDRLLLVYGLKWKRVPDAAPTYFPFFKDDARRRRKLARRHRHKWPNAWRCTCSSVLKIPVRDESPSIYGINYHHAGFGRANCPSAGHSQTAKTRGH